MMFTKKDLINSVLNGIKDANDFYEKISVGAWLSDAGVESVLQTKIAESIFNGLPKDKEGFLSGACILMEFNLKEIIDSSGSEKKRGPVPQLVNGAKRVDILICDENRMPLVPIEVKRNAAAPGFAADAKRILTLLRRSDKAAGGSVKYGLICGFLFGKGIDKRDAESMLRQKKSECRENLKAVLNENNFEFYSTDDEARQFEYLEEYDTPTWWIGGAACVYLKRKSEN